MMYNSINCYNQWGTPLSNNTDSWLQVPSFTVSVTKNKFVAVGCDTYAFLTGTLEDAPFTTGCLSKCNDTRNIVNGNSSGIGCCHMDIPEGLKDINFSAYSFNSHKDVWSFNPCSFAFIIQKDKFSFSSAYLTSLQNNETFQWFLTGQLVTRRVKLLGTKGITYVEQIAIVLISKMVLGTVAVQERLRWEPIPQRWLPRYIFNLLTYLQQVLKKIIKGLYFSRI